MPRIGKDAVSRIASHPEEYTAYASLLRHLIDRGLKRVRSVASDNHGSIKAPPLWGAARSRVAERHRHFQRSILSRVPNATTSEVAEDLKAISKVRKKIARDLAEELANSTQSALRRRRSRSSRLV